MDRVSKHQIKIILMMRPKMENMMRKLMRDYNDSYFKLPKEEKEIVAYQLAATVINSTLEILNYTYTADEVQSILEISRTNLQMLEQDFTNMEMYSYAQIMKDSRDKVTNEIFELVGNKL